MPIDRSLTDAENMIEKLCGDGTLDKTRYEVIHGSHTWEADVFHARNEALVTAKVELQDESENIELPEWLSKEVTGDTKYFNVSLLNHPCSKR